MIDEWLRSLGSWGYLLLGLAALLEYLFPPFPGDTVTVAGGAWAARQDFSLVVLHLVLTAFSVLGVGLMWRLGRNLGGRLATAADDALVLGVPVAQLRRAQDAVKQRAVVLLLTNRFLPSFRAVLFLAAGSAGVPLPTCLALGAVSAAVFNALLLFVGATIGDNAERLAAFFSRFQTGSLVLLGVLALGFGLRWWWRRKQAPDASHLG